MEVNLKIKRYKANNIPGPVTYELTAGQKHTMTKSVDFRFSKSVRRAIGEVSAK